MDFRFEHALNRHAGAHPTLDWIARHVAESQWLVVAALLILAVAGIGLRRRRLAVGATVAIVAAAAALVGNVVVSHIWTRPRPFVTHPGVVHLLVHHAADASFPSDHSAALAAITIALALTSAVPAAVGFGIWTILVGLARVYVGEHYPGDIVGGWIVGVLAGTVVALAAARFLHHSNLGRSDEPSRTQAKIGNLFRFGRRRVERDP